MSTILLENTVLAFINPDFGMKTNIFVKTSVKGSFLFQTLLGNIGIISFWKR
jgi:hypothetical protein